MKYYNLLIRVVIITGTLIFLAYQVFVKKDFANLWTELQSIVSGSAFYLLLVLVLVLMPLNWGLEAWKWKFLVKKSEDISFRTALKAVFAGISVSSLSPNRVGEFFGRVFVLRKTSFWRGVIMTVLGSYAQTFVTLFFGFNAFAFFIYPYVTERQYLNHSQFLLLFGLGLLALLLVLCFFLWIARFRFLWERLKSRYSVPLKVLELYRPAQLLTVLGYSLLRYVVFSIQYLILLLALNVEVNLWHGLGLISVIFFLNTVRPSIALLEIGIRYTIAFQVFMLYYEADWQHTYFTEVQILLASSILWLVNIVIPALIGLFFVNELKFVKNKRNGQ